MPGPGASKWMVAFSFPKGNMEYIEILRLRALSEISFFQLLTTKHPFLATPEVVQLLMGAWVLWEHQEVGNHIFFPEKVASSGGNVEKLKKKQHQLCAKRISTFILLNFTEISVNCSC